MSDSNIVSLKSGRLDPGFSIQLQQEDAKYLSVREQRQIDAYNKLLDITVLDEDLEKLRNEYFIEYFK